MAQEEKKTTYTVGEEEITLTRAIVRNYLTRGNAAVTDPEIVQFMAICQANKLNPFVGDCYLVKYNGSPASMITSKEAFMKRAETGPNYEGFQAGVIVLRGDKLEELEGSFYLPDDKLVGGWCRITRSDRSYPIVARVRLAEYTTGKSTWAAKPGTMIRKVAIAQAFREAYPVNLGGLYTPDEMPDEQEQPQQAVLPANSQPVTIEPEQEPAVEVNAPEIPVPEPEPIPVQAPEPEDFNADLFNPDYKG